MSFWKSAKNEIFNWFVAAWIGSNIRYRTELRGVWPQCLDGIMGCSNISLVSVAEVGWSPPSSWVAALGPCTVWFAQGFIAMVWYTVSRIQDPWREPTSSNHEPTWIEPAWNILRQMKWQGHRQPSWSIDWYTGPIFLKDFFSLLFGNFVWDTVYTYYTLTFIMDRPCLLSLGEPNRNGLHQAKGGL